MYLQIKSIFHAIDFVQRNKESTFDRKLDLVSIFI